MSEQNSSGAASYTSLLMSPCLSSARVFQFYTDTEVQLILMHSINHDGSSTHHSSLITSSVMNHDYGVKLSHDNGYLFNFHKDNDYIDRKDLQ